MKTGNFFPPEFKQFPFKKGDVLASPREGGKFALSKIISIDKVIVAEGSPISIQGQVFVADEDDWLFVIGHSMGAEKFSTLDEAKAAALRGSWEVRVGFIPNRATGAAENSVWVANEEVTEDELQGYDDWKVAFAERRAGIF